MDGEHHSMEWDCGTIGNCCVTYLCYQYFSIHDKSLIEFLSIQKLIVIQNDQKRMVVVFIDVDIVSIIMNVVVFEKKNNNFFDDMFLSKVLLYENNSK